MLRPLTVSLGTRLRTAGDRVPSRVGGRELGIALVRTNLFFSKRPHFLKILLLSNLARVLKSAKTANVELNELLESERPRGHDPGGDRERRSPREGPGPPAPPAARKHRAGFGTDAACLSVFLLFNAVRAQNPCATRPFLNFA